MVRGASWKPFEIELIKKLYSNYEKEKLLKLLPNRTWRAISDEAQRLGIRTKTRRLVKTFPDYPSNLKIGSIGEEFAKTLLEREGYKVYNFRLIGNVRNKTIEKLAQAKTFFKSVNVGTPNVYDRIPSLKRGTQMPDFIALKETRYLSLR